MIDNEIYLGIGIGTETVYCNHNGLEHADVFYMLVKV